MVANGKTIAPPPTRVCVQLLPHIWMARCSQNLWTPFITQSNLSPYKNCKSRIWILWILYRNLEVYTILNWQSVCTEVVLHSFGPQALGKMLDARQLGLKMIANVTYGYTAASFSGRMPCVEIADSIVRKGRETLERAIQLVNSTPEWKARVVYGDTDRYGVILEYH